MAFARSPLLRSVPIQLRALFLAVFLLSPNIAIAIRIGNPSILVTALLLFCCFDTRLSRRPLRVFLLALACSLKPQIGLPFLLCFLVKRNDGVRTVWQTLAIVALYTACVLAWCAAHPESASWLSELRQSIALGSSPGFNMNPSTRTHVFGGLLNLQYVVGYWVERPGLRSLISNPLIFILGATFLAGFWRMRDQRQTESYLLLLAQLPRSR